MVSEAVKLYGTYVKFKDKSVYLWYDPKTGYCSICPNNIFDGTCKRTNMHHEQYGTNPLDHVIELCTSCHIKRTMELKQMTNMGKYIRTPQHLKHMSEAKKGQIPWNKGKKNPLAVHNPQTFRKGYIPWNKGKKCEKLSEEHKMKISLSILKHWKNRKHNNLLLLNNKQ